MARTEKNEKFTQVLVANLKDMHHLADLVDWKIILKWPLHKQDGKMRIGFFLLRIRTSGEGGVDM